MTRYHEHLVVGSKSYLRWSVLFSGLTVEKDMTISRREQLMKKPIPLLKIMVKKKHKGMFTEEQFKDMSVEDLVDILDDE